MPGDGLCVGLQDKGGEQGGVDIEVDDLENFCIELILWYSILIKMIFEVYKKR